MQITMDALESALAPIEAIGKGETTFDINGVPFTLRVLLPEEDAEVQKFSAQVLGGSEGEEGVALEYLERFKMTVLSYAVIAVGNLDFRGVQFVETSEKLANGQTIKIPKADALRRLMAGWSGLLRSAVFRKYVDLVGRVEKEAEKVIKFEPTDLDSEIERLERRLEQLKSEREQSKADAISTTTRMARAIVEQEDAKKTGAAEAPTQPPSAEAPPAPAAQPPARRQSVIPVTATPPAAPVPVAPAPEPVEVAPGAFVNPNPRPADPAAFVGVEGDDSLVDFGDPGAVEAAVEAENRRLLAARQGRGLPAPPSVITAARETFGTRTPPHAAAQETEAALHAPEEPPAPAVARAEHVGKVGDTDTFRLPPEEIVERRPTPQQVGPAPVNPTGGQGKVNPRFKPSQTGRL